MDRMLRWLLFHDSKVAFKVTYLNEAGQYNLRKLR